MSSVTFFNIFLERIMSDALEEDDGKVSIGGRNITNLRFADDIDALAEEEQELEALVESLDKTCSRYKMELSADDKQRQWHPERDKGKRAEVRQCNELQALEQLFQMMAPNQRFSQGLHKPLQLSQS